MQKYEISKKYKTENGWLSNIDQKNWVHFRLKKGEKIFLCKKCLTLSTRPRAQYDEKGICNACHWAEDKKKVDWKKRWRSLDDLCDQYRRNDGYFDILVPGSGGKDSMIVSWKLKHQLGMHPLCITLAPQMPTEIGRKNLEGWINAGFDHIMVNPHPEAYRKLAKVGLLEEGRPKMPFETGITTVVVQLAIKLNIPLIMYGEQGEIEYGGDIHFADSASMNRQETIDVYFSGFEPDRHVGKNGITEKNVLWWKFPNQEELDKAQLRMVFWSWFENWDPYEHYLFAKKQCGFKELPTRSTGTYTNFAQLDDDLQDLHAYLMYIKFGFGRCWSDACIDIRRGAMDRKQAIALVKAYDGEFPQHLLAKYCDYFKMTEKQFWQAVDSFRSPDIWENINGKWQLKFKIE